MGFCQERWKHSLTGLQLQVPQSCCMPCSLPHLVTLGKASDHHTRGLYPQEWCQPLTIGPHEPFLQDWGSGLPSWHPSSDTCRCSVERSLWKLYRAPNPSPSLKFFFSELYTWIPPIALSEREKQPLAKIHCFYDNTKARTTIAQRISTANLQVALWNTFGFHILILSRWTS